MCPLRTYLQKVTNFSIYQKYSNFRQTGNFTCGRFETASQCSSTYWCFVLNIRKLACVVPEKNATEIILLLYIKKILSCSKQEVDMQQIRNCVTWYSSPYWCFVPNIRKLAWVVPEKNVTEIILWQFFLYKNS